MNMKHTIHFICTLVLVLAGLLPMTTARANHFEDRCTRSDSGTAVSQPITIPATITIGRDVQEGEAYGPWLSNTVTFTCTRTPVLHFGSTYQPANDYFEVKTTYAPTDAVDRGVFAADPSFHVYSSYNLGFIARITEYIDGQPPQTTPLNKAIGGYTTTIFKGNHARQAGDISSFHRKLEVRLVKLKASPPKTHLFYPVSTNLYTRNRYEHEQAHAAPVWKKNSGYAYYLKTTNNNLKAACKTPDQTVDLGTTYTASLQGPDGAGPATDFTLRFEKCPPYLTAIDYQFHALAQNTITNGILPLVDLPDKATGVGVQVLMPDGVTPLAFDTTMPLDIYNANNPAPLYEIPLKARIVRTPGALGGGKVKALMQMEVTYK